MSSECGLPREVLDDALRYWEIGRIAYDAILASIAIVWLIVAWPAFALAPPLTLFTFFFVMAIGANLCYCAAYVADFAVQRSSFREAWRRWRWLLWLVGTAFAVTLENNALAGCCALR